VGISSSLPNFDEDKLKEGLITLDKLKKL